MRGPLPKLSTNATAPVPMRTRKPLCLGRICHRAQLLHSVLLSAGLHSHTRSRFVKLGVPVLCLDSLYQTASKRSMNYATIEGWVPQSVGKRHSDCYFTSFRQRFYGFPWFCCFRIAHWKKRFAFRPTPTQGFEAYSCTGAPLALERPLTSTSVRHSCTRDSRIQFVSGSSTSAHKPHRLTHEPCGCRFALGSGL